MGGGELKLELQRLLAVHVLAEVQAPFFVDVKVWASDRLKEARKSRTMRGRQIFMPQR